MKVDCKADSHVGLQRQVNQDSYGIGNPAQQGQDQSGYLLVVCDGMGGHAAGEIASKIGVESILQSYAQSELTDRVEALQQAFAEANRRIYEQGRGSMGTTGVAALFYRNKLHVANVGDSRAYLVRQNKIRQISQDHSFVWEQVEAGVLTPEQARFSNYRNMITRALGHRGDVEVDIFTEAVQTGDVVLLSSDGLHGLVEDAELAQAISTLSLEEAVPHLINMANERGGSDNITVMLARVDELDRGTGVTAMLAGEDDPDAITLPGISTAEDSPPAAVRPRKPATPPAARWFMMIAFVAFVLIGGAAAYSMSISSLSAPPVPPVATPTRAPSATAAARPSATATARVNPTAAPTARPTAASPVPSRQPATPPAAPVPTRSS